MLKNITSNAVFVVVQIVVLMQLTAVQVGVLGADVNGVWLTIASLTSILSLLVLGIPMASVRFIAEHAARNDLAKVNAVVASCLTVCLVLGAGAIVAGCGLALIFEHGYIASVGWESVSPRVLAQARIAFWILVMQSACGFAAKLPLGILEAHHEFVARNGVLLFGIVIRFIITVGLLRFYPSLIVLGAMQAACLAAEFGLSLLFVRRRCPGVRFGIGKLNPKVLRPILGFSAFAMVLNVGSQIAFRSDALVIGATSPAQNTFFDIGNKFFLPLLTLVLAIGSVVMPLATKLRATGKSDELRQVFLKWSKIAYSFAVFVGAFLLILSPEFIGWWMGPAYAQPSSQVTRVLMVSFLLFLPARGVALPILMGLGKPERPAIYVFLMGVTNLLLSVALVKHFGIVGVAIGTAVPCAVFAVAVAHLACQELGVPAREYVAYVLVRPTLGALVVTAVLLAIKTTGWVPVGTERSLLGFLPLLGAGVASAVVFVGIWAVWVYRNDPYVEVRAVGGRFAPRLFGKKA